MTSRLRRAAAFAVVGSLVLAAPLLGQLAAVPFAAVAIVAAVTSNGPIFDLFARPSDREDRSLYGLTGFALAATGLGILAGIDVFGMPSTVYAAAVLVVAYGNLGQAIGRQVLDSEIAASNGFVVGGFAAAVIGQLIVAALDELVVSIPEIAFLAATAALVGGLLRSVLFARDDPLVMCSAAMLLWLLADIPLFLSTIDIALALAVTAGLAYTAYVLDAASIPGMLTGALLALLTIVLGGFSWFAVLIAFFGIGALSTKFRYEEKIDRGVAEDNEGARGSRNVLGNSSVALLSVIGYAAAPDLIPLSPQLFLYAFTGSLAAALGDTLSSEIGGVFDDPILITSLERVEPGTDGGVTWQGEVAGIVGAGLVGAIALLLFDSIGVIGAGVVVAAGIVGMTVDSLLGATVEGGRLGNQSVNFLATLAGGLTGLALGLLLVT